MESNDKAAAMYGMEMAFPFLDRDLLSFLMAIPGEMQTWNGVPKALLRRGFARGCSRVDSGAPRKGGLHGS